MGQSKLQHLNVKSTKNIRTVVQYEISYACLPGKPELWLDSQWTSKGGAIRAINFISKVPGSEDVRVFATVTTEFKPGITRPQFLKSH
jgi:hypothetical protein